MSPALTATVRTVEEGQRDAVLVGSRYQLLLRLVLRPGRRQTTGIFR
jgi:hypothetical protein